MRADGGQRRIRYPRSSKGNKDGTAALLPPVIPTAPAPSAPLWRPRRSHGRYVREVTAVALRRDPGISETLAGYEVAVGAVPLRSSVWAQVPPTDDRSDALVIFGQGGAMYGIRTRDHWNHNPVLYQLS